MHAKKEVLEGAIHKGPEDIRRAKVERRPYNAAAKASQRFRETEELRNFIKRSGRVEGDGGD
jgi:hypothetical protein